MASSGKNKRKCFCCCFVYTKLEKEKNRQHRTLTDDWTRMKLKDTTGVNASHTVKAAHYGSQDSAGKSRRTRFFFRFENFRVLSGSWLKNLFLWFLFPFCKTLVSSVSSFTSININWAEQTMFQLEQINIEQLLLLLKLKEREKTDTQTGRAMKTGQMANNYN